MLGRIVATGEGHRLEFTRDLPAPVERVWRMLTDPDDRATWMFAGVIEPRVGGVVDLADAYHRVTGRVTAYDPPHVLALTWSSPDAPRGEVRFELTALSARTCRLRLVHAVGGGGRPRSLAAGWHALLTHLGEQLPGTPPGDRPGFAELVRRYEAVTIAPDRDP